MSKALADRLIEDEAALIVALDGDAAPAIDAASHRLAETLRIVAAAGGWRETPELAGTLKRALALAEAAAARINFLSHQTRRRLDHALVARGNAPQLQPAIAYGRRGYSSY